METDLPDPPVIYVGYLPNGCSRQLRAQTMAGVFMEESRVWMSPGVILAGVVVFVVCGSNSLPFHIVGPFVAPLTEFAQFIAIGPDNSVPQRHRASGMAAYVALFAVATAACSRYYAAPYVTA
eukprot:scaffold39203_cov74-Phaeocystis_antarctica.AAC.1